MHLKAVPRTRIDNVPLPQPPALESPKKMHVFGLIRLDNCWSSRQAVGLSTSSLVLFPAPYMPDINKCDINNCSQFTMTPANSILGLDVGTFRLGSAQIDGRIWGYFSGFGFDIVGLFGIGQAYLQANWAQTTALIGQDFHPFVSRIVHPTVLSMNAGAPFAPMDLVPQIRVSQRIGNITISPTVWSEFISGSDGPNGASPAYLTNSGLPAFSCLLEYETNVAALGLGLDIKQLVPRLYSDQQYATHETITSYAATAYANLQLPYFAIIAQIIGGQNAHNLLLLGGYGVSDINKATNRKCFTNTYFTSVWTEVDFKTNSKFEPGIFIGYTQNKGTRHTILYTEPDEAHPTCPQPEVYGLDNLTGLDMQLFLLQPGFVRRIENEARATLYVRYIAKPLELGFESEFTRVVFGLYDKHARVVQAKPVTCLRLLCSISYYF